MNEAELQEVVDAWIAATEAGRGSPEHERHWWAIEKVLDWKYDGEPELLWRFVLAAYKRQLSNRARACLAAGALEDLLSSFGTDYIERVEELAARDPDFNWLLGGVWRLDMTDDVWARVQATRREVW